METEANHIAGRYGYCEVTPTVAERERGFDRAFMVIDMSRKNDDGFYEFVSPALVSRNAAVRRAQEFARYEKDGGESLNRAAIREWAAQLTA
jgi:hypothetical protein